MKKEKKKQHLEQLSGFMRIELPEWSSKVRPDKAHARSLDIFTI